MLLNQTYYRTLWDKYQKVPCLPGEYMTNSIHLTINIILDHYKNNTPIHFNFQNSIDLVYEIGKHLFIELANDIYLNHYDLPDNYKIGDKLKRVKDNQYYEIVRVENDSYTLRQALRKMKADTSPALLPDINYDRLTKFFVKVDSGISEKTIKNYFNFFENLNGEKTEFLKTRFERKSVFIAKKNLWDYLPNRNKIPCAYLPNPREENNASEIRSIPALSDCLIYFTPKYEVCYQSILSKNVKVKTVVVFDTEADKIEQMLQDKARFGFNLIIISNSLVPVKKEAIPCWNWFKEEIEILNTL